jgi:hypothetical protein
MDKFQIPEAARPFTDALRKLVATGVTAAPGLDVSPLVTLKAVMDRLGDNADAHRKAVAFTELLADLTRDGKTGALMGKDREVAARLFGMHEWAGVPSRQRYEAIAKLYDKRWTWENFRKEPLDRHLYAVYLALYRQASLPTIAIKRTDESHSMFKYKLCDYDITYRMPLMPGQPREELEVREIEALTDGVESWSASTRYWGKAVDVGPDVTLFGPGNLVIRADTPITGSGGTPGRAYITEVMFPTPLKKGQRIRFTLLKRQVVNFDDLVRPEWQDCQSLTPSLPVDRVSIRVNFPEGQTPSDIWYFEDLEDWLVPGVSSEASRINAEIGNTVVHTWQNPQMSASYGIAWRW